MLTNPPFKVQKSRAKIKFYKQKITASIDSGYEQALAISCELTCSQSSPLIAQNIIGKRKLTRKIPLPVLAVAVSKPKAMSCELTCSQ
jgi:hypothetical protein